MDGSSYGRYSELNLASPQFHSDYGGGGGMNQHHHHLNWYGENESELGVVPSLPRGPSPYAEGYRGQVFRERPEYLVKEQAIKNRPLTKQVDHLIYHLPQHNRRYASNPLHYAPAFIKVFSDVRMAEGGRAVFDCVLIGSPRPKVCWLFNNESIHFDDVTMEDTADLCRITILAVGRHHYGAYTVLAENEVGRAVTTASLFPAYFVHA